MTKSSNIKIVLVVLLFIWAGTLSYIWLPGIIPDFLHLRGKSVDTKDGMKEVVDGLGNLSRKMVTTWPVGETVHVVITSDRNTLGGMVTLIHSIMSNTRSPVFFHLITDRDTSNHLRTWLKETKLHKISFEIQVFPLEWVAGKIRVRGGRAELANPLNYARFYLPDLFPGIDGRVVYIDDDCIVQGDIAELYHMPLKPGTLASFSEDCMGMNKHVTVKQSVYADFFEMKNKHIQGMGIDPETCAFNTGVFVTQLSDWRQLNITDQLLYWLELNTKEKLYGNENGGGGSQPPMMLVFYKKYTPLDELWHVHFLGLTTKSSYSKEYIQNAKLLHWNGRFKPWGPLSAYQEVWDHYFIPDPTHKFQPVRMGSAV